MTSSKLIGTAFAAAMLIPAVAFAQTATTTQPPAPTTQSAAPATDKSATEKKADMTKDKNAKKEHHASLSDKSKKHAKAVPAAKKKTDTTDQPAKQ